MVVNEVWIERSKILIFFNHKPQYFCHQGINVRDIIFRLGIQLIYVFICLIMSLFVHISFIYSFVYNLFIYSYISYRVSYRDQCIMYRSYRGCPVSFYAYRPPPVAVSMTKLHRSSCDLYCYSHCMICFVF